MGGAPVEILTNVYPTVKGNAPIMGFIRECGVVSWHEEQMNADFKTAHLYPANFLRETTGLLDQEICGAR